MATTDTELQQLVINVGTEAQIEAGIASGTITSDMLSIATDGADITYDWVGTLAEYNEQNVATNHPDWLCFITDDVNNSGEDVYNNVYSKTTADEIFVAKTDNLPQYLPSLLEFKWSDCILNRVSWLRADTFSWQSGSIYEAVYEHLLEDIAGKTLQSETINGITIQYYEADDKHKICPASEENNIIALYNSVGVAWYYILDITNERFKLPRTKFGFTGLRDSVGKYIEPGLPNPDIDIAVRLDSQSTGDYVDVYGNDGYTFGRDTSYWNSLGSTGGTDEYLRSSMQFGNQTPIAAVVRNALYGASTIVQPPATEMYLYFYVGEFTQDAITNIAGVTTETLNSKLNRGEHEVIEFQAPTVANNYMWYRKYADGWVEQGGLFTNSAKLTQITFPVVMADTNYSALSNLQYGNDGWSATVTTCIANGSRTTTGLQILCYYNNTYNTGLICWEVKGMAAA